jgi:predicted ATPase
LAAEHGLSLWLAGSAILRGWAIAAGGDVDVGTAMLRNGINDWKATGAMTYCSYFLGILAETRLRSGQDSEAAGLLDEALALADRTGEGLFAAELHRLRGEALACAKSESPASALECAAQEFSRALEIAKEQQARSLELRAVLSMLRRIDPRDDSALEHHHRLSAILGDFTEGLQTPDLQEARAALGRRQ